MQRGAEAEDFIDLDASLRDGRIDLPRALASAQAIYGTHFNPRTTLKALSFCENGNLGRLPRTIKDRLAKTAREVDLDSVPSMTAAAPSKTDRTR